MKLTPGEKTFFAIVALSALWVGAWAYIEPALVQNGIPWSAPQFHARLTGAAYLSAFVFCVMSASARSYAEVRIVLSMIAIWTLVLLIVTPFYLTLDDYDREPIWIWLGALVIYLVIAPWLMFVHQGSYAEPGAVPPMWARLYFLLQALILIVGAVLLLALPGVMIRIWPWDLTPQLARLHGAPVLCFGVASFQLARVRRYREIRIPVAGMLVFAVAVLVASAIHREMFASASPAMIAWFAGFAIAALILAFLFVQSGRKSAAPAPPPVSDQSELALEPSGDSQPR